MLTLLKRFSWFEWFAIAGVIALGLAAIHLVNKYDRLITTVAVTEQRAQQAQAELKEEERSAAITDTVVFDYTLTREFKIEKSQQSRDAVMIEYFNVRDTPKQKEAGDVRKNTVPPEIQTTPIPTVTQKTYEVVTSPEPDALAVLAAGMLNSYCNAYHDPNTCTP